VTPDPKLVGLAEVALSTARARRARRRLLLAELRYAIEAADLPAALRVADALETLEGMLRTDGEAAGADAV
jgi:hypothetical protein